MKITLGATVLVDYGDWFEGPLPQLDGKGDIQVAGYVSAAGVKTFDRGNRSHSMEWVVMKLHDSPMHALAHVLAMSVGRPAGGQLLTIELQGYEGSVTVAAASITGFKCGTHEQCSRISYSVMGGVMVNTLALAGRVLTEEGEDILTEDGKTILMD